MTVTVRSAVTADLSVLPAIELSGEAMFAEFGIVVPAGPVTAEGAIVQGADILVAGEPPEGFAAIIDLDGHPHLEQISVRADQGRKGIGSLLLAEVTRRTDGGA